MCQIKFQFMLRGEYESKLVIWLKIALVSAQVYSEWYLVAGEYEIVHVLYNGSGSQPLLRGPQVLPEQSLSAPQKVKILKIICPKNAIYV